MQNSILFRELKIKTNFCFHELLKVSCRQHAIGILQAIKIENTTKKCVSQELSYEKG